MALGDMYNYGQRVRKNFKEAVKWYRLSANQGHAAGHASLGVMHNGGYGTPPKITKKLCIVIGSLPSKVTPFHSISWELAI